MGSPSLSLWQRLVETTEQALNTGALQPISTQLQVISDQGIDFCVRVVDSLARKEAAKRSQQVRQSTQPYNPFLPYEEALFVADLSKTHVCLLNKFNVVDYHILIITRHYESQDSWLSQADFEALTHCFLEMDGLGFYNAGKEAGASQHHKHLQMVPFPPGQEEQELPISQLIHKQKSAIRESGRLSIFPFRHSIQFLPVQWTQNPTTIANGLLTTYKALMTAIGMDGQAPLPTTPYNLLITREWMMAVPRSQDSYQGIGVNSLGYAGWMLVKTMADLEQLKTIGPVTLLHNVGQPSAP